jgi:hypothetical protein
MEKIIKNSMFKDEGNSTPLYEENSTIVESNNTTAVKIKMKTSEVFLLRVKVAEKLTMVYFTSLYEMGIAKLLV